MFKPHHKTLLIFAVVALALFCFPDLAFASDAETGLEWEGPMRRFGRSITGPVAFWVSLIGLCGAGFALVWGGEINEWLRKMIMVVLVISGIVFAASIMRTMFGGGAATIAEASAVLQSLQPWATSLGGVV